MSQCYSSRRTHVERANVPDDLAFPRTRSRNRSSFSGTSTPRPDRAGTPPGVEPAIPPPTTITSNTDGAIGEPAVRAWAAAVWLPRHQWLARAASSATSDFGAAWGRAETLARTWYAFLTHDRSRETRP